MQDTLPPLGFKTYFVRVVTNESVVMKGLTVTSLTPTKRIPRNVKDDIFLENEVRTSREISIYY